MNSLYALPAFLPTLRRRPVLLSALLLSSVLSVAEFNQGVDAAEPVLAAASFQDPLDFPAKRQDKLQDRPLMAITQAGDNLVAVGMRGLIMVSSDQGATWHQAQVPVQSDLLAAMFPSARNGWAVGHDGVILHSADGGENWTLQLDGRRAQQKFVAYYQAQAANGNAEAPGILEALQLNYRSGPSLPYLSVWFENDLTGYAVGSFGSIVATHDGGKTWLPWNERLDNPDALNLNGIYGVGKELVVVGERGHVFKFDPAAQRFETIETGYEGSFFSVLANSRVMLAFGLRGKFYHSEDQGRTWSAGVLPATSTVASGVALPDDRGFVLVNAAGEVLDTGTAGGDLRIVPATKPMRLTAVVATRDGGVVVAGLRGIGQQALADRTSH